MIPLLVTDNRQPAHSKTATEETFVRFSRIATYIAGTPFSTVSLIDEDNLYFKAEVGLGMQQIPSAHSFTAYTVQHMYPMIISDTTKDQRFTVNPLVVGEPYIRFYAGFPISIDGEKNIGALCVLSNIPHSLSDVQIEALSELSRILEIQINHADLALTDDMTGLLNRRGFYNDAKHFLQQRQIENEGYALIYFDIDDFKLVNDQHGHAVGDIMLRIFAKALRHSVRSNDIVARLGGDEFCVLISNAGLQRSIDIPNRLRDELKLLLRHQTLALNFSSGTIDREEYKILDSPEELLALADKEMYREKREKHRNNES